MSRLCLSLVLAAGLGITACEKDSCTQTWTQVVSVPVTLDREAVQDSIAALPARELCTGGNLYAYGEYVFINANREGYHLLDNSDPAAPRQVAFLRVPGATHMAFVDGQMVSDSYADIVVLDFGGPADLRLVSSTPNLLLRTEGFQVDNDRVAVGFEDQEVTFTQGCDGLVTGQCINCGFSRPEIITTDMSGRGSGGTTIPQVNTGGSLARLAFCDRTLYALAPDRLTTFQLVDRTLTKVRETNLGGGQESIVLAGDFLYVASQWGLRILEVGDCGLPLEVGFAPRFWNNDPVAIEGDRAVVTLRNGNVANENLDGSMLVYDISDRTNPRVIATHPLRHPVGVALRQGKLYICDGWDGLLVYDFDPDDAQNLPQARIQQVADVDVVDLALLPYAEGPVLLGVGQHAVSQFRVADDGRVTPLSTLAAEPCRAL